MLKWTGAFLFLAASAAGAQENIFSTNTSNNSASVTDGQTFVPLPPTGSLGPNTISTGANSAPKSMFYDPIRTQVYAVNTSGQTVVAIDPLRMTTKSVLAPNLAGPLSLAAMSADGRYLYAAGGNSKDVKVGIFRFDLDDFSPAGVTFVGGLTPAASTTYTPVDVEVLAGKAYFTYTSIFSGTLAIVFYHIGEVDLSTGVFTDLFAVNATSTTQPRAFTRMTRSPDGSFVLVAASTGSAVAPTAWQVPRINPGAVPVVDVVSIPTGSANEVVDDFAFTTSGTAPFTVCMLARDDSTHNPRFFSIGATGAAGPVTNGPAVPSGFGGSMTPDLAHNRIFFANNGSTAFPNHFEILSPPTPAGAFRVANPPNSGGPSPQEVVVAPAPPRMQADFVTQPGAISTTPFQLEIHGRGFLQGSSRARVQDNSVGILTTATTTTVLSDGVLLGSFPGIGTAQNFDVSVVNNDGQLSVLNTFFQGLANPPTAVPFTVPLPPLTAGYSMLSFPQYATVGDLRAGIAAQLGPYNPVLFRLFLWEGTRYLELNNPQLSPSQSIMGTGFFALSRLGDSLTLAAPDVALNAAGFGQRVVALEPGWNIISQPWLSGVNHQIALAALQVTANRDLSGLALASVSPLVTNVVYEPVNGTYASTTTLIAGKAYWMLNQTAGPVYMIFNQASVTKPSVPSSAPSAPAGVMPPPMPGESLNSSGGGGGGCGLLGGEALLVLLFLRGRGRRKLAA